jgi:hypothetical protein
MAEIAPLPFDIIEPAMPPAPPPDFTWLLMTGALIALMLVIFSAVQWRRTRHKRLARKKLARARQAFHAGTLGAHDAAFAVAEALRIAFGVTHLTATEASVPGWQAFIAKLDSMRYREGETPADIGELFKEAARWLRGKAPC